MGTVSAHVRSRLDHDVRRLGDRLSTVSSHCSRALPSVSGRIRSCRDEIGTRLTRVNFILW